MGKSAGGPQGTSGTQTIVNQSQPPQAFLDAYTNLTQRAQNQSQAPLQQYSGPLVQGFNPQQDQAFGTVQNLQGVYAPYLDSAAQAFSGSTKPLWQSLPSFDTSGLPSAGFGGLTAAQNYAAGAAQPIDVSPYTGMATQAGLATGYNAPQYANFATTAAANADTSPYQNFATQAAASLGAAAPQYANFATQAATGINPAPYQNLATKPLVTQGYGALPEYLSPYTQNVTNALQNIFNQQNATQLSQVRGNAAAQGALGGDREAVAEALTAQQQQLAQAPAFSQALQQGYQQAQQALAQQQNLQLQQGVQQGQLALGAGQLGTQAGAAAGQLGLGAGQLINQAAGTQGQLGLGAGQLGLAGGQLGVSAGLGAGQLLNQAAATQGQLGLGAAGATTQALGTQGQLSLGAGQLTGQMGQAALNEFNQQQQAQLAAEQANSWLSQGAAFGLGQLGSSAQNLGLAGAQAEGQMGAVQQQLAQQQLNIPFEQFSQQQAFPYQQLNWLAPMVEGLGAGAGGTSASTSPGPSAISQVAGLGLTGLGTAGLLNQTGAFGSQGWLSGLFNGGGAPATFGDFTGGVTPLSASTLAGIGDVTGLAAGAGGGDAALAGLLLAAARGGRIGRQGGGPIPSLPDPKLGLSAEIPHIGDLSYLQSTQPRGLGMGIPKPPTPSSQPSGLDPDTILKDLTTAESMLKLGKQLAPTGEAGGGSISPPGLSRGFHPTTVMPHLGQAPHLGATGIGLGTRFPRHLQNGGSPAEEYTGLLERHGYQGGGMPDPLVAAAPLQGTSPNVQSLYQQFTQMPMERLQELSLRVSPTTTQGQLIQRALQAKRMTPQISAQPLTLDTGTMQGTGLADGGRIGLAGGGQTGPAFPGLSPGMSNAQPPAGFFGGAPVSFPNLSAPSTINFPRGPVSFPPASPAPLYQAPLGLYAPSLRPAQDPFRGFQSPNVSLPTSAPVAGRTPLPQPQPYLPTTMGGSSGNWPQPYQYHPTSPVTGPASPAQPINFQSVTAPTLDPGMFTSHGSFGQVYQQNLGPYGADIPNADIRLFSLPQLSRGGTPFAPSLRMGRQEGGDTEPPATGGVVRDRDITRFPTLEPEVVHTPFVQSLLGGFRGTSAPYGPGSPEDEPNRIMRQRLDVREGKLPAPPAPQTPGLAAQPDPYGPGTHEDEPKGLSRPIPSKAKLTTEAPSVTVPLGEGSDAPVSSGLARDQEGRLTRNGQPPDTVLPGGAPPSPPVSPASASGNGLAAPTPKVSATPAPTPAPAAQPPEQKTAPASSADDVYAKIIRQISEQTDHQSDTGQQIYSSPWMLPLTMGAGMLASRSPFPGQALGEGLLTGTKFLGQQQAQLPQNELRRAQADVARMGLTLLPAQMEAVRAAQTAGMNAVPTGATAGSATAPPIAKEASGFAGPSEHATVSPAQVAQAAMHNGFDPVAANVAISIESDHGANAVNKVAPSYQGLFQMGPEERASVGGSKESIGSIDDQLDQGTKLLAKRRDELAGKLGREPSGFEVWLAHNQGVTGATKLLTNPNVPAGELVAPVNISNNGGDPKAPASQFISTWQQKYAAREAQFRDQGGGADQVIAGAQPRTQVAQAGPQTRTDASGGVPGVATSQYGLPLPASVGKDPRFNVLDQQYADIGAQINQSRAYLRSPAAALDPKQWTVMQGHLTSQMDTYTRILTNDPRMKGAAAQLEAEGRLPSQLTEIGARASAGIGEFAGKQEYELGHYQLPLPNNSGTMTLQAPLSQIRTQTAPGLSKGPPIAPQSMAPPGEPATTVTPQFPNGIYDPSPQSLIPTAPPNIAGASVSKIEHSESAKGELAAAPKTLEKYRAQAQDTPLQLNRLQQLDTLINQYHTGAGAPAVNKLMEWASYNPITKALIPKSLDPANAQEINKLSTQLVFAQIKQIGGKVLVSEIDGLGKANPNIALTPEANHAIIQNLMLEQNMSQDRFLNAQRVFSKYKQFGDFDQQYIEHSPVKDFENTIRSQYQNGQTPESIAASPYAKYEGKIINQGIHRFQVTNGIPVELPQQ